MKAFKNTMCPAAWIALSVLAFRQQAMAEVKDNAGIFSSAAIRQADQVIQEIRSRDHKDVVFETYPSIPDDVRNRLSYDPQQQSTFFNQWARDRARTLRVNGIYVLICRDPRFVEVGAGRQTEALAFTRENRQQLQSILVNDIVRQNRYDEGLLSAVQYVQQTMQANLGTGQPQYLYQSPGGSSGSSGWWWLWAIVIVLGVVWLIARLGRLAMPGSYGPPGPPPPGMYRGGPGAGFGPGGYPQGGYPGGYGGGGGFGRGIMGGLLGGAAGGWLYDRFFRGGAGQGGLGGQGQPPYAGMPPEAPPSDQGRDFDVGGARAEDQGPAERRRIRVAVISDPVGILAAEAMVEGILEAGIPEAGGIQVEISLKEPRISATIGRVLRISHSVAETEAIAAELAQGLRGGECIALNGELGAGKTQFVRGLLKGLGGDGRMVSSPTFVLLNVYESGRLTLYHLDAYRVHGPEDFEAIGFAELLEQGSVVVVEWAQRIEGALPENRIEVSIRATSKHRREIVFAPR